MEPTVLSWPFLFKAENFLSLFVVFINDGMVVIDEMHKFWVIDLFLQSMTCTVSLKVLLSHKWIKI